MDRGRRSVAQALMETLVAVELEIPLNAFPGFRDCPVILQLDLFVFQ